MNQILTTLFFTAIQAYNLNSQGLQAQWENQIWKDCSTDKLIEPFNCDNNDQKWKECYLIPKSGMCVTSTEKFQEQTIIFQFTFNKIDSQQPTISINDQQTQATKVNGNKLVVKQQVKGQLKIKITSENSILEYFQLSKDCFENCKICDSNYDCGECQENYSLFNYECVSDSCFNDLGMLSTKSASLVNAKITQNYEVNISFDVNLGTCLIPRAYLIKNINTNQIEYVLPKNQVQIQNSNQLSFYITFDQIYKNCQELKKNETTLINQCYIGIALTLSKISQYNLILIGQIQTNLQTQSSSVSTQTIEMPDDNTIQINAANEISSISLNKDILVVKQTVFEDTQFDNINFKQAYMLQDNERFDNLDLQISLTKGNEITYRFKILDSDIDYNKKIELIIQSDLVNSNRILVQDRSSLEIQYSVSQKYELKQQELQQINKTKDESKFGKYLIIGATIFIGVFGLAVLIKQFTKKGIQMNEDNQ